MTNKLLPLSLLAASTLCMSQRFESDTTLTLGTILVPVTTEISINTMLNPSSDTIIVEDTLFNDSIGRVVKSEQGLQNVDTGERGSVKAVTELDSSSNILFRFTDRERSSTDFSSTGKDTLIGGRWNSVGQISEGLWVRHTELRSDAHGTANFLDSQWIEFNYDSTEVNPTYSSVLKQSGFLADTFYTAGLLTQPVRVSEHRGGFQGAWSRSRSLIDEHGRILKSFTASGNSKHGNRSSSNSSSLLDTSNNIAVKYSSSSGGMGGSGSNTTDTLTGYFWNSIGNITKGRVNRMQHSYSNGHNTTRYSTFDILYAYDSTGGNVEASHNILDSGFQAELLYKAGDIYLPVAIPVKNISDHGASVRYEDSLGRVVYRISAHSGPGPKSGGNLEFNKEGNVKRVLSWMSSVSTITSSRSSDTLVGTSWNDKGMIVKGRLYRYSRYSNPGGTSESYDDYNVTVTYDSTGIVVVDVIKDEETSVVSSNTIVANSFAMDLNREQLSIRGLKAFDEVSIVNASGRVLLQGRATADGALNISTGVMPSGVYFLVSNNIRKRFVK